MAPTRALFASIGASVALVAAAALALLAISAVFAFGGWSDSMSSSDKQPALIFAGSNLADPGRDRVIAAGGADRIVAPAPERAPRRERPSSAAPAAAPVAVPPAPATGVKTFSGRARTPPAPEHPATGGSSEGAPATKAGDRVRKVGDSLSSTVKDTGTALSNITQPLAPPVSAAVQQVLNLVAEAVRRAADGLGGTVDRLLPPKR